MPKYEQQADFDAASGADEQERETSAKPVLHLFKEAEGGDTYAARDLAHAKELWKSDTGQDPDEDTDWEEIPDEASLTVDCDGTKETKTALEWAAEMASPGCCFGENY